MTNVRLAAADRGGVFDILGAQQVEIVQEPNGQPSSHTRRDFGVPDLAGDLTFL